MIAGRIVSILLLASVVPEDLDSKISCYFFSGGQCVLPVLDHLARNEDGNMPPLCWEDPLAMPCEIPCFVVETGPRNKQSGEYLQEIDVEHSNDTIAALSTYHLFNVRVKDIHLAP